MLFINPTVKRSSFLPPDKALFRALSIFTLSFFVIESITFHGCWLNRGPWSDVIVNQTEEGK